MSGRTGYLQIVLTTAAMLLLTIIPLPGPIDASRPDWMLLLVIYWSLNAPMLAGQTYAFCCGLIMDALVGQLIGQHALTFALTATIAQHFQLRIRVFPLLQQAVVVLLLTFVYHAVTYWIDGIVGNAVSSWQRWLPVFTGAVIWPVVVAVLDTSSRRR